MPVTAADYETLRGDIEREFSTIRDEREKQYVLDKLALEDAYHTDIKANEIARGDALGAAGLNRDGSRPYDRPTDGS